MTPKKHLVRSRRKQHIADPARYTPFYVYRQIGSGARRKQALHCEESSLVRIADQTGTPTYVYSAASIEDAYHRLDRALGSLRHTICYAVKANSNLSVLRLLNRIGSSFDIVSGGELDRLRHATVAGSRIVFSGVGKTREEIREALRYGGTGARHQGIFLFNVESESELDLLLSEAAAHVAGGGKKPSVAIRVNPDVLAGGHRHISTGHHQHKFGVDWETARRLYLAHKDSRSIVWRGISTHIGSQILTAVPYRQALARVASYVCELAAQGIRLDHVDIGGGLGIRYTQEQPLDFSAFAKTLAPIIRPLGCRLLVEPGRVLVGPAGVLLTRVLYVKENGGKTFVIVDAAMNDLIRPVLYDAIHPITRVLRDSTDSSTIRADVVGPICETGDFLARDAQLECVAPGDVLAIWAAGAYGFAESSNYNARRRAAEVLVEGSRFRVARRRETYEDLLRGEI